VGEERHQSAARILNKSSIVTPIITSVLGALILVIILPLANPVGDWIAKWRASFLKHDPDNTLITHATDGNQKNVQTNGITPSQEVSFAFIAYKGPVTKNVNIANKMKDNTAKFVCDLDYEKTGFSECLPTYQNLPLGTHYFQVKVNDTNTNKQIEPAKFNFTVVQSVLIEGWLRQNNTPVTQTVVTMDGKFTSLASDDFGKFNFPFIEYRREVIPHPHNFTIPIPVQGHQTITCNITYNFDLAAASDNKIVLNPFDLGNKNICPKNINLHLSSSSTTTTTSNQDYFKPGNTTGMKQYAQIDLRYNVTLVRKPTTNTAHDGLWNIVLYLKGPEFLMYLK
jgi:hypothetical protein